MEIPQDLSDGLTHRINPNKNRSFQRQHSMKDYTDLILNTTNRILPVNNQVGLGLPGKMQMSN